MPWVHGGVRDGKTVWSECGASMTAGGETKGGRRHGSCTGRSAGQSRAAARGSAITLRTCRLGAGGRPGGRDDRVARTGAPDQDASRIGTRKDWQDDEGEVGEGDEHGHDAAALEHEHLEGSEDPDSS